MGDSPARIERSSSVFCFFLAMGGRSEEEGEGDKTGKVLFRDVVDILLESRMEVRVDLRKELPCFHLNNGRYRVVRR